MTAPEWTGYFAIGVLGYFVVQSALHDAGDPGSTLVVLVPLFFLAGILYRFARTHRAVVEPTESNRQHARVYTAAALLALGCAIYLLAKTWKPYTRR